MGVAMPDNIRVLIVEDSSDDAELMARELERDGFNLEWERVETEGEYLRCLGGGPQVILSDSCLPQFDGLRALDLLQQHGLDIPFLLVSGHLGEDRAVEAMKRGVYDYVLKDRLARLGGAVRRALEQRRLRGDTAQATEALRRSEEHYRLISEVTADYAYTLREGTAGAFVCEWTTEAFPRITGFTLKEINMCGWNSLYHPDDLPIVDRHHRALALGKPSVVEVRTVTKEGDVRWVRVFGRPVPGSQDQRTFRIYGAAQDITTNRDLEQQLLHAQKMEAIGRLAGGVAHDFNNLLTIISGYGGMLKEEFERGDPNVENLKPILHAAGRAEELLPGLLNRFPATATTVVLDPPRTGCWPESLELLRNIRPGQIIYVSCHPATMARDLNVLCSTGVFDLLRVNPLDMFPQTAHVECVADLRLKPGLVSA